MNKIKLLTGEWFAQMGTLYGTFPRQALFQTLRSSSFVFSNPRTHRLNWDQIAGIKISPSHGWGCAIFRYQSLLIFCKGNAWDLGTLSCISARDTDAHVRGHHTFSHWLAWKHLTSTKLSISATPQTYQHGLPQEKAATDQWRRHHSPPKVRATTIRPAQHPPKFWHPSHSSP